MSRKSSNFPEEESPLDAKEREGVEEAEEKAHRPYRNPWLLLIAFVLLPAAGFILAQASGLLIGVMTGIGLVILYPALQGR